ncbi:hypothetical protein FQR65_LT01416 [Abscondita terminalis]|nr:hypothetical protein FQR65_LT01416 [Abscondita terminalis]
MSQKFNRPRGWNKWVKNDNHELQGGSGTQGRERHPPNLRGKAIGLYYAKRSQQRKQKEKNTKKQRPGKVIGEITLPEMKKQELEELLESSLTFIEHANPAFKTRLDKLVQGKMEDRIGMEEFKQNIQLDAQLKEEFKMRQTKPEYKSMLAKRKSLPSYEMKDNIVSTIETNQVSVISGETGCGKTTQVAQFILDDYVEKGKGSACRIICTQPRRISAISIAERVATERSEQLGEGVGYHIRLEKVLPRERGSILFCTIGVVLRQMESDPSLSQISHLILDEIHERSIESDLLLSLFKQVLQKRSDIKLVLMSATLNAEKFSAYYNNCVHLNIPGFTYPVEEYYLEDVLQRTGFTLKYDRYFRKPFKDQEFYLGFVEPYVRQLEANKTCSSTVCEILRSPQLEEEVNLDLIFSLIVNICETEDDKGAILVFLTGMVEISSLHKMIENSGKFPRCSFLIIPLHSQMPTVNQKHVFDRPPNGVRKIVLSTNIAETSVTIDDVVFVIDCGKIKMTDYDAEVDTYTLKSHWVALANANQRRGRAGRVQPGMCFHLFTRPRGLVLEQYQKPEILRTRLENTILTIKVLQLGKCSEFLSSLMDPPKEDAVEVSVALLKRLNALDDDEKLTALGYHLAKLPIAPQMGKMVLFGAMFSCLDPILSVAASLDFKDAFMIPLGKEARLIAPGFEQRDHHDARQFCFKHFLSINTLNQLQKLKVQFMDYLHETEFVDTKDPKDKKFNINSNNVILVKAIICAGLYPNVGTLSGKRRNKPRTIDGFKVKWHPKSVLSRESHYPSHLFVYYLKLKSSSNFIHDATIIYPLPLVFFGDKYEFDSMTSTIDLAQRQLRFKSSESTSAIVKKIRDRLNWFLEYKISNPGVVDWTSGNEEIVILRAVMELITSEELDPVLWVVASLDFKDALMIPLGKEVEVVARGLLYKRLDKGSLTDVTMHVLSGELHYPSHSIKKIRDRLNCFLKYKIEPSVVDWTSGNENIVILRAVMELIISEELDLLNLDYDDFD